MRLGSLCTGYGGLDLAVESLLGCELAWVSEIEPAANRVLELRFPGVPNLGDLRTAEPEPVDIVTAGFPCQPVSTAGQRQGTDDERWLFDDLAAFVGRMDPRPRLLMLENVTGLLSANGGHAMARVVHGLARLGYVGRWRVVRASDVGAPHRRARVFIVAAAQRGSRSVRFDGPSFGSGADDADADYRRRQQQRAGERLVPVSESNGARAAHPEEVGFAFAEVGAARSGGNGSANGGGATRADADRFRRARLETGDGPPAALDVEHGNDADRLRLVDWGEYERAVRRWERLTGRAAPAPTDERRYLNPRFVEWMMGLPAGWVTDAGISRSAMLRVLGNGVVPAQAEHAYRMLLA